MRLAALAVLPIVFSVLGVPAAAVAATHVETVAPSRVTSEHVAGRPVPTAGAVTRSARNAGSPRLTGRWQGAFHPKGASAGVWALRAEPLTGTSAVVVSPSPSPSATGPPAPSCTLPSAPGSVSATAGSNQATVSWAAASGNASYVVREVTGAEVGASVATDGTATGAILSGLSGGTSATFSVVAENSCGTGPAGTSPAVIPTGSTSTYVGSVQADQPSAFYRLADPSGTVMADSSGNSADGDYSGQEVLGQPAALASDPAPSASYSTCCSGVGTASPALAQYDNPRTIEAWINTTDTNAQQALVTWGSPNTDSAFVVSIDAQSINVDGWNDLVQFITPRPLDDGAWHLVTVTFDGTTIRAFLDGRQVGESPFSGTLNTLGSDLSLADAPFGDYNQYGGDLADVAVYPTALTASRVAAHFSASGYSRPTAPHDVRASYGGDNAADVSWGYATATNAPLTAYLVTAVGPADEKPMVSVSGEATAADFTGLAAGSYTFQVKALDAYGAGPSVTTTSLTVPGSASTYASTVLGDHPSVFYRLADGSTSAMADSSGKGATGSYDAPNVTLGAAAALASDPAPSVATNGNTAGQGFPTLPLYSQARTLEGWVDTTSNSGQYLAGYGTPSTGGGFALAIEPDNEDNAVYVDAYNDTLTFTSPVSLDDGNWHFIAVTTNGTSATAYVDGTAIGTQQFGETLDTVASDAGLVVGGSPSSNSGVAGDLADVAVFPSALTGSQLSAQFAASGYSRSGAPGSPSATAGANEATVSWSAPAASTPPVESYLVTALVGGTTPANSISVPAGSTTATVTGLVGGGSYRFRVQALNVYGAGAAATTSSVTPTGSASTYASTVLGDHPSVFYRLADGSTSAMADSSGKGATGSYDAPNVTLGAAAALASDPAPSVATNGNPAGKGFPSLPLYSDSRTLEGWINTTSTGFGYIAGYGTPSNTEAFSVGVEPSDVYIAGYNDDLSFTSPVSLDDGNWHFIAVTTNGTSATVYVDGNAIGTQNFGTALDTLPSSSGFIVGAAPWGQGFAGDLADVAVFPSALSAAQVSAQYSTGTAGPFQAQPDLCGPGALHLSPFRLTPEEATRESSLSC